MRRRLSWLSALRDLREDRASPPAVREVRLRTAAHLRTDPPCAVSAWRGLSGRRHVVTVYAFDAAAPDQVGAGVPIAVRRDADGLAHIVAVGGDMLRPSWWARARDAGATELHVHRLAESAGERAAVAMDLFAS